VLLLVALVITPTMASETSTAQKHLLQAWWKYNEYDQMVKVYEKKHLSKDTRIWIGNAFYIGKIMAEQKIVWKVTF